MFRLCKEEVSWDILKDLSWERGDYQQRYMISVGGGTAFRTYLVKGMELLTYEIRSGATETEWANIDDLREISPITSPAFKVDKGLFKNTARVLGVQFFHEALFCNESPTDVLPNKAFFILFPEDLEETNFGEFMKFYSEIICRIDNYRINRNKELATNTPTVAKIAEYALKMLESNDEFDLPIYEFNKPFETKGDWSELLFRHIKNNHYPVYIYCYRMENHKRIATNPLDAESVAFRKSRPEMNRV